MRHTLFNEANEDDLNIDDMQQDDVIQSESTNPRQFDIDPTAASFF